jgi:hypothetical protein
MAEKKDNSTNTVLVAVIVMLLGVVGYLLFQQRSSVPVVMNDTEGEQKTFEVVTVSGIVSVPEGITPEKIVVMSLWEPSPVEADGSFDALVDKAEITPIFAMLPDVDFAYISIVLTTDTDTQYEINSRTTAVAMIFMNPAITTPDPSRAALYLNIIESDPTLDSFASAIDAAVLRGDDPFEDPQFISSYQATLLSSLERIEVERTG